MRPGGTQLRNDCSNRDASSAASLWRVMAAKLTQTRLIHRIKMNRVVPHNRLASMPLYEYQCKKCGRRTEKIRKFSDPAAALKRLSIDGRGHAIGIGAVAHAVAALDMDDVHIDPLGPIDLARKADDDLRRRLDD